MKTNSLPLPSSPGLFRMILLGAAAFLSMSPAFAQTDGSWTSIASGTQLWSTATNWSSNPTVPGGVGSVITIQSNIVGATNIDLVSADRTVGTLNMGDSSGTSPSSIISSGGGKLIFNKTGGAVWNVNQGGQNSITSGVTLDTGLTINQSVTGQSAAVTGIISGTNGITQNGPGRVYFNQTNTFSGGFTLNSGTAATLLAGGLGTGTLSFNGGTLELAGGNLIFANAVNLGGNLTKTGGSTVSFSGAVTLTANSQLTTSGRVDIAGNILGAFQLTKDGSALLNLGNTAKSFSGGFVLNAGEVLAQHDQSFGTGTLRLNGGILGVVASRTFANTLQLAGATTLGGAFGNGTMTFSGNTTLVADSTLNIVNTGLITMSGPISGSGNLTKTGANNLVLQGTNTHTGYTEVQAGTLNLRGGAAIADTSEVRVSGGTLDIFLTPNETVGSLVMSSGAITASSGGVSLTASSFSFTNSGTVSARLAGGSATLTKSGSGTVTLDYASGNTYGGGTIINAGTLVINNTTGSATGSGAVTVAVGAGLAGNGIISGPLEVSGALRPGNSIGAITVANDVTWNGGNAWVFELGTSAVSQALAASGSSTQDQLLLTGAGSDFLKGTGSVWTFDFAGGGQMGWYELITWSGSTTFAATDFQVTNLGSGLSGNLVFNGSSTGLYLNVVPEPSTVALALFALAIPLLRRRLRSRRA